MLRITGPIDVGIGASIDVGKQMRIVGVNDGIFMIGIAVLAVICISHDSSRTNAC